MSSFGTRGYGSTGFGSRHASPATGIEISINGEKVGKYLQPSSYRYTDNLNSVNRASFILIDTANTYRPDVGQQVIVERDGIREFAGTIESIQESLPLGTTALFLKIECVDYNQIFDRHLVANAYTSQTLLQIVTDIINVQMPNENITLGGVETGPTIEKAIFNYVSVTQAFNDLSKLTGYSWYLDYFKDLKFIDRGNFEAPFAINSGNQPIRSFVYNRTRNQYRNKQYIRAGEDSTDTITNELPTPKPDGVATTFILQFPLAVEPTIKVNTVAKTVGVRSVDTGKDWYWKKGEKEITQDSGGTVLTDSDTLEVTYKGLVPIIVRIDDEPEQGDRGSVEGGSGVYTAIEENQDIDSVEMAFERAEALIRRHGVVPTSVQFTTNVGGLRSGQLIDINLPDENVNAQFLIDKVTAQDDQEVIVNYQVTALSGEHLGSWVDFFRRLATYGRPFVLRENEVLLLLRQSTDAINVADSFNTIDSLDDGSNDPYTVALASKITDDEEFIFKCGLSNVGRLWS